MKEQSPPELLQSEKFPRVAVVILTWNGKELLRDCLLSFKKNSYPNFFIIVVDNHSSDDTFSMLKIQFPEVIIVVNEDNLSFAEANNRGILRALREKADLVLLMNNDTVVDPDFVQNLVQVFKNDPKIGIAGPKIYYHSEPDKIWFAGGKISLATGIIKHIGIREIDKGQYDKSMETDYIAACSIIIKREVFEKIGYLDNKFRIYCEDADFCLRAKNAGYRVVYVPEAKVWHKISASTGGQLGFYKLKQRLRSQWIFFKRYCKWWHWLIIPFFQIKELFRVLFLITRGRIKSEVLK